MTTTVCEHGTVKRKCEICERDARIAELVGLLEEVANAPTQIRCECTSWPSKYVVTLTADQDTRIRAAIADGRKR
jgi:hypothetical protein